MRCWGNNVRACGYISRATRILRVHNRGGLITTIYGVHNRGGLITTIYGVHWVRSHILSLSIPAILHPRAWRRGRVNCAVHVGLRLRFNHRGGGLEHTLVYRV